VIGATVNLASEERWDKNRSTTILALDLLEPCLLESSLYVGHRRRDRLKSQVPNVSLTILLSEGLKVNFAQTHTVKVGKQK